MVALMKNKMQKSTISARSLWRGEGMLYSRPSRQGHLEFKDAGLMGMFLIFGEYLLWSLRLLGTNVNVTKYSILSIPILRTRVNIRETLPVGSFKLVLIHKQKKIFEIRQIYRAEFTLSPCICVLRGQLLRLGADCSPTSSTTCPVTL